MGQQLRGWRLHLCTGLDLKATGRLDQSNRVRVGVTYYGQFCTGSALHPFLQRINTYLMRWAQKKYRRLRGLERFQAWWTGLISREPGLFKHWAWTRTVLTDSMRRAE